MSQHGPQTRQQILRAALKRFANGGYAATSIQQIVGDAKVSKPALYYYFRDKAGLFQALVNEAHDERFQVVQQAAGRGRGIRAQLVEILAALFDYFHQNRELTRIAFATAFAAPGEVPPDLRYLDRCQRNLGFIRELIRRAQTAGELGDRFNNRDLAYGFYGLAHFFIASHLLMPDYRLNRRAAVRLVDLFLAGAEAKAERRKPVSRRKRS
ncbi:MAG TPA: TetR/AcrR family transcriptional regulator [Candidatus Acidoferrum sp.]|nr:TetR/AcrR family transcriptional regulator [Candidatus Acidoferrum sp.]